MDPNKMELINDYIKNGGNISYILFINIKNAPSYDTECQIKKEIFDYINDNKIIKKVDDWTGQLADIKWRCVTPENPYIADCYHCDVKGIWTDVCLHRHTKMVLKDIMKEIDGVSEVTYLILKPLTHQRAILF